MSLLERIVLWSSLSVVIVLSVGLIYAVMSLERQVLVLEEKVYKYQSDVESQLATAEDVYTYLEEELVRTQTELSLETSNLQASLDEQAAELRAETKDLKVTTQSLESNLNEETQARLDSGASLERQLSSLISEDAANLDIERLLNSVVLVACEIEKGNFVQGSGTFVDAGGVLITNAHVVDPKNTYSFAEERLCVVGVTDSELEPPVYKYTADIITLDHDEDMSTLRISGGVNGHSVPSFFTYLPYPTCATKQPALNDEIFIVGYPIIGQSTFTITNGIVSGFLRGDIKTSAKIDEGNSGGAAVNMYGEFIGIPTYGVVGELESLAYVIDLRKRKCQ